MTFAVDAARLARSRFAVSPLVELVNALEVLAHPQRAPYARGWVDRMRRELDPDTVPVAYGLIAGATWYIPDFLSPLPTSYEPDLARELSTVAATPADEVRRQLRLAFRVGAPPPMVLRRSASGRDPRGRLPAPVADVLARGENALLAAVVDQFTRCWRVGMSELWAVLRRVLEEDIRHRATVASREGFAGIISGLHRSLDWDGARVTLDAPPEVTMDTAEGLILVPSAFLPRPAAYVGSTGRVMLGYPARGRGRVWSAPGAGHRDTEILGHRRSAILADLRSPRTTTELAQRHALSPATVSYHVGRLRRAGLISSRRTGREILHERTRRAADLLRALHSR